MSDPRFYVCMPSFAWPGPQLYRTPGYSRIEPGAIVPLARRIERLGFDGVFVPDHLMTGRDDEVLEGWTTLAAIAGATSRLRLGLIKQSIFFRPPVLFAKMAATLDQLSGGRFMLFAGTGAYEAEHRAYGFDWPAEAELRTARLAEWLDQVLALWGGATQAAEGATSGPVCAPPPLRTPPVWLSGHDAATLRFVASRAQGWNLPPLRRDELRRRITLFEAAMSGAPQRRPSIEVSLEVQVLIAASRDDLRRKLRRLARLPAGTVRYPQPQFWDDTVEAFAAGRTDEIPPVLADSWLIGTPDMIAAQLGTYADLGIDSLLLWFVDLPNPDGLRLFSQPMHARRHKVS